MVGWLLLSMRVRANVNVRVGTPTGVHKAFYARAHALTNQNSFMEDLF